jgi:hypothetical protein
VWPLAGLVFAFQQAIELEYKFHHLIRVLFIADSLGFMSPITRLRGHGKPPFYFWFPLSYSGLKPGV